MSNKSKAVKLYIDHCKTLHTMGLINSFELFNRVFQYDQTLALKTWGNDGLIFLDLMTALIGTSVRIKDVKILKEEFDATLPIHKSKTIITFSVPCTFEETKKLDFNLRYAGRYFKEMEVGWDDFGFDVNVNCICVIKFSC